MIKVGISEEAFGDLQDGFWFYEAQEPGLGEYFATSLRADIEGLKVTGGIHRQIFQDYRRLCSAGCFLTRSSTPSRTAR